MDDETLIDAARDELQRRRSVVIIDDDAAVSRSQNGAYVEALVFVPYEAAV